MEKGMVIVLMGVSGSGKTTIGRHLARELGWAFYDGDDFHPQANVDKMAQGIALRDEDRLPWLRILAGLIGRSLERGESAVLACSALKARYREILLGGGGQVRIVHLKGAKKLIARRLNERVHRYMPPSLLHSQFEALEEPGEALEVDIALCPGEIVRAIRRKLGI